MANLNRIPEPARKHGAPPSDKVNSPFKGEPSFPQTAETVTLLRQQIIDQFQSGTRRELFLVLADHLELGLHKKALMDAYEATCGKEIDEDKMATLNLYSRQPTNSPELSPDKSFYLQMKNAWFRIAPPPGYVAESSTDTSSEK